MIIRVLFKPNSGRGSFSLFGVGEGTVGEGVKTDEGSEASAGCCSCCHWSVLCSRRLV